LALEAPNPSAAEEWVNAFWYLIHDPSCIQATDTFESDEDVISQIDNSLSFLASDSDLQLAATDAASQIENFSARTMDDRHYELHSPNQEKNVSTSPVHSSTADPVAKYNPRRSSAVPIPQSSNRPPWKLKSFFKRI
jgi:hypothetical protein